MHPGVLSSVNPWSDLDALLDTLAVSHPRGGGGLDPTSAKAIGAAVVELRQRDDELAKKLETRAQELLVDQNNLSGDLARVIAASEERSPEVARLRTELEIAEARHAHFSSHADVTTSAELNESDLHVEACLDEELRFAREELSEAVSCRHERRTELANLREELKGTEDGTYLHSVRHSGMDPPKHAWSAERRALMARETDLRKSVTKYQEHIHFSEDRIQVSCKQIYDLHKDACARSAGVSELRMQIRQSHDEGQAMRARLNSSSAIRTRQPSPVCVGRSQSNFFDSHRSWLERTAPQRNSSPSPNHGTLKKSSEVVVQDATVQNGGVGDYGLDLDAIEKQLANIVAENDALEKRIRNATDNP